MFESIFPFIIAIVLIIITVIGDSLIKNASLLDSFCGWKSLLIGSILYGLTGLGWFFVMRHMKLSTLGVFYGVGCAILLALIGVFYFREQISSIEVLGIILGLISLIILFRFA
jgi:hypothetical protein